MITMGRSQRRAAPVAVRVVGVATPVELAERFSDLCYDNETTPSEVLRQAINEYMRTHSSPAPDAPQEVLPLREAS